VVLLVQMPEKPQTLEDWLAAGHLNPIALLLLAEFALAVLSDVLGRVVSLIDSLLSERVTNATSVRQELTQTLPTSRTLVAAVLLAPNVHATGPNGTNGADGSIAIGGAMSFDSLYLLNGVQITENLRGQPYTLFIEDAIQETTVSTSGISAEYGRFGGGVVNAITKSGGNMFSGSYRQSFNNDSWRTLTPYEKALAEPARSAARLDKTVPTYEYTAGGPLLRDRLWFFTAGRIQKQQSGRTTTGTNIPYTFTNDEKRYEGKLTYSPTSGHTVRGTFTKIQQQLTNQNFGTPLDLRTLYNQGQPQDLFSLNYKAFSGRSWRWKGSTRPATSRSRIRATTSRPISTRPRC